ncbi:LytTR family DNA-binding domain-containing protein [Sphingobacterium siyangense]|uniref:LytR/AlgR family response regulator transcription factor n=1 Tax=Sphingobacterium siyangense TaxID=459529 RepID=UPI00200CFBF1|nr:LytTR family DNA-binding domain-containing protein [Sphingobacterium siyangense]UQA75637.1 LytTR family DNA-binding domain-containing protein [Sphingobacterium siyangense]
MYKAIIIDDEEMARTLLQGMIEEYCPEIKVVDLCSDLPSGIKSIRKQRPDLIFLDIEMPRHSGLELLDFFDDNEINFDIIFVTAYDQYAIQAFKLSAIDYLLKPIDGDDLIQAVRSFENQRRRINYSLLKDNLHGSLRKIALSTAHSMLFVPLEEILFFKAEGSYTHVFLNSKNSILTSKNLKYYEEILSQDMHFYRCHKSYLININYLSAYIKSDGGYLKIDQHTISVSADKIAFILDHFRS